MQAPVKLIVYYPASEDGKAELAKRVSDIHASAVNRKLKSLRCPEKQKLALLDAVIRTVREETGNRC